MLKLVLARLDDSCPRPLALGPVIFLPHFSDSHMAWPWVLFLNFGAFKFVLREWAWGSFFPRPGEIDEWRFVRRWFPVGGFADDSIFGNDEGLKWQNMRRFSFFLTGEKAVDFSIC